jgi:hypothetical protein
MNVESMHWYEVVGCVMITLIIFAPAIIDARRKR